MCEAFKLTQKKLLNIKIEVPYERDVVTVTAKAGQTLKDLVDENEMLKSYLECACDGNAACSTCHVVVHKDFYGYVSSPSPYRYLAL